MASRTAAALVLFAIHLAVVVADPEDNCQSHDECPGNSGSSEKTVCNFVTSKCEKPCTGVGHGGTKCDTVCLNQGTATAYCAECQPNDNTLCTNDEYPFCNSIGECGKCNPAQNSPNGQNSRCPSEKPFCSKDNYCEACLSDYTYESNPPGECPTLENPHCDGKRGEKACTHCTSGANDKIQGHCPVNHHCEKINGINTCTSQLPDNDKCEGAYPIYLHDGGCFTTSNTHWSLNEAPFWNNQADTLHDYKDVWYNFTYNGVGEELVFVDLCAGKKGGGDAFHPGLQVYQSQNCPVKLDEQVGESVILPPNATSTCANQVDDAKLRVKWRAAPGVTYQIRIFRGLDDHEQGNNGHPWMVYSLGLFNSGVEAPTDMTGKGHWMGSTKKLPAECTSDEPDTPPTCQEWDINSTTYEVYQNGTCHMFGFGTVKKNGECHCDCRDGYIGDGDRVCDDPEVCKPHAMGCKPCKYPDKEYVKDNKCRACPENEVPNPQRNGCECEWCRHNTCSKANNWGRSPKCDVCPDMRVGPSASNSNQMDMGQVAVCFKK